ncbi:(E,E)-geranyllinalool synthase-like [Prunus avium]|uniref:(E,E)-geranyllinalool synthase-like n=1 Tax=Prunus avium TaxID=42229 RepID=A0A6P5TYU5_PRUAV|nr:(E,E)-geranyllinalool synthase-like [Prunus avium]
MDLQGSSVKNLVTKVKQDLLASSQVDVYGLVTPSPYDTAWLSMVSNPQHSDQPLFQGCLDWVLQHQNRGGFWGENIGHPTIECLTSTLACIVALTTWNVGHDAIQKGLAFIHGNTERLLEEQNGSFPEWFAIVFPAMIELAENKGLHVYFCNELVEQVFLKRQEILQTCRLVSGSGEQQHYPALMLKYLEDGLIQSPSAIAYAFMKTGNKEFLVKLNSIVQTCGYGVPAVYPLDEDLVKILLINQIETLGLAEHFTEEITSLLGQVYRSYISCEEPMSMAKHALPLQLYKHSLAFRLLRLHGYRVSPRKFCRFLEDEDIVTYIEEHHELFLSAMYNVYRATDVTFTRENQLEDARAFSRRILEKETKKDCTNLVRPISMTNLQGQIKHELSIPWLARLDHLEHRRCIERKETLSPWTGNSLSYRLSSCESNAMLVQLAIENYTLRQSIFRNELKELERWSKEMGLADMGFARQKTTYCHFAVASTASNSSLSDVRLAVVKSAILVTVTDDFFDTEGSMDELEALANAVNRNSLMLLTRLLNEIRSYQKEQEEGKPNLVLLYMKENPNLGVEESIAIIQKTLDEKKTEFLELALSSNEMPEACKQLHLQCLKAFQMFFNSTNAFDSPTELLADINKAIFDPLRVEDVQGTFMPLNSLQNTLGLKKDKSLASHGKSHYSSFKPCNGFFKSTCAIKVQGNSRKHLVTKPYSRILSLEMRNPTIYKTFSKPKAYIY